ncbi:hypothetical protein NMG60_11034130 [Bertholletia excelsa]
MEGMDAHQMHKSMTHMTFFWGKDAEILFSGWPGRRSGMYALAVILVFLASAAVEWFSNCRLIKENWSGAAVGLARTAMHGVRIALAYLVMLALMSFNVGVFIAATAGHMFGFLLFGSRLFKKPDEVCDNGKGPDLPPLSC